MSSTRPDLKFSDAVDERLFYRKFANLPPKDLANVVRVVDHKDYFSALGEDAQLVADAIYKTLLVLKTNASTTYVTISPQVFASLARFCVVDNSYKLEVYNKQFQLVLTATPGNLEPLSVEYGIDLELMLRDALTPMVASVKFVATATLKKVGVCLVDLLNKAIHVSEFDDNDLFSNLELLFLQLNVKEVIVPASYNPDPAEGGSADVIKLFQVLNKIGSLVIGLVKLSFFSANDIDQDLSKIVTVDSIDPDTTNSIELILASRGINSSEYTLSLSCCNALIHYLNLLGDDAPSFSIDKYNLSTHMKLDSSTMKALNIFPQSSGLVAAKSSTVTSIFELLNKCKTAAGTRLLSQWLKQPLTDLDDILNRQSLVAHFIADTNLRVFVSLEWLSQVPDVKRLLKKIANGIKRVTGNENKKLEDVVRLYQLVTILPDLINMLQMSVDDAKDSQIGNLLKEFWLDPISKDHTSLLKYQELVETTIDLSPLNSLTSHDLMQDFNIRPEFDESLIVINDNLQATSAKIKKNHEEVADDLNIDIEKKLKLEKHQQHGWCFRVTRIDSSILRNTGDKYIELQTVKAGVFFTTKKMRALSQQYMDYSSEYNSKQKELIKEILSITITYQSVFLRLSLALSTLDILSAFANVAIFAPTPLVKPKLHAIAEDADSDLFKQRRIRLHEARHPVLEVQDEVNFIANDVDLANEDGSPFVIITGPNMGGKSTYIRQVGVIALMSQVGSYVPALEDGAAPELPVFDAILSRVGAGDSQLKGLSTFMIEMLETSLILAAATHNSLIIIDELGRGTSTYDGFGLAWSISEHLITSKRCFTLFATHFHELTKLADKYEGKVQNLHVVAHIEKNAEEEQDDDITLMYKVEPGISDKSFGIHVAELVKFPTKIINMAKRKASELQHINAGSDIDPYVNGKRTKCSNSEVSIGVDKLKKILVSWREQCMDPETQSCKVSSDEAILTLRNLVDGQYKLEVDGDKFIQEILSML